MPAARSAGRRAPPAPVNACSPIEERAVDVEQEVVGSAGHRRHSRRSRATLGGEWHARVPSSRRAAVRGRCGCSGLTSRRSLEEIRAAWKARVAQAHPDHRPEPPGCGAPAHRRVQRRARRVRALGGQRAALADRPAGGLAVGARRRRVRRRAGTPAPPRRQPTPEESRGERRSGLRPGDLVRVGADAREVDELARVLRVTAAATASPVLVELDDGRRLTAAEVEAAAYGCPVCGWCEGPAVEHARRRPCTYCLGDLRGLERGPAEAELVLRRMVERARTGSAARRRARRPRPGRARPGAGALPRGRAPAAARRAARRAAGGVRPRLRRVGRGAGRGRGPALAAGVLRRGLRGRRRHVRVARGPGAERQRDEAGDEDRGGGGEQRRGGARRHPHRYRSRGRRG